MYCNVNKGNFLYACGSDAYIFAFSLALFLAIFNTFCDDLRSRDQPVVARLCVTVLSGIYRSGPLWQTATGLD